MLGDSKIRCALIFRFFIGVCFRFIPGFEQFAHRGQDVASYLDQEFLSRITGLNDLDALCAPRAKKLTGHLHITQRCREPDPGQGSTDHQLDAVHQRLQLFAALTANKGMQFINDDVAQVFEHCAKVGTTIYKKRFQGFRGDE